VTLPEGLLSIGGGAFSGCAGLTALYIPSSVESIGRNAFYECDELILTVERDSFAAQYAKENEIEYTYPDINAWLKG